MREYSIAYRLLNGKLSWVIHRVYLIDDEVSEWERDGYIAIYSGLPGLLLPRM